MFYTHCVHFVVKESILVLEVFREMSFITTRGGGGGEHKILVHNKGNTNCFSLKGGNRRFS